MSVELLTQLYVGYYNRAPDPAGLVYWVDQLAGGMSASEIAQSFAVQDESKANYPYLADQSANDAQEFINKIYQNLFNRAADPEGLAYWTGQLEGGYPIGVFILAVINGAKNTEDGNDKTMLENKVSVGIAFKDAETGKDNPSVIADAKDVMADVTHTDASVKLALGKIADGASGATTVFSGDDLAEIEDGTLLVEGNKFTNNVTGEQPDSILVTNGAEFEMTGAIHLGGASSMLTVRGENSSANFKATFDDDERSDFGRFSGDHSSVYVADGATLTIGKGVKFGRLLTEEDAGTVGGTSKAELNILGGGKVYIGETAKFADDGEDDGGDNTATSKVDVLIHGEGSLLEVGDQVRAGGSGGDVTFDIRSGGKLVVENDLRFARSTDYNPDIGGKGALEVRGATSSVEAGRIKLALDKGTVGSIFADDGATIQTERVDAGGMGGSANIKLTDGAKIVAERLDVANGSGSTATVDVLRGAKIELSDNLSIGQFNNGYVGDEGIELSTPDGATNVDFTIAEGGIVSVDGHINAAVRWELDDGITVGNESAAVNLTVTGEGSLLESKIDWSNFGVSKNGVANVKVLDGAKAIFGEGANFGQNSDKHDQFGGEGNLTVSGEGSSVSFIGDNQNELQFAQGEKTKAKFVISDGATVAAGSIRAGTDGGAADLDIDGGHLTVDYNGAEADNSSSFFLGRDAAESASTLDITNGGTLTIDGSGKHLPMLSAGRGTDSSGHITVSGEGSQILIVNDNPRTETQPEFGNGYIVVAREGEGSLSVLDGGKVINTESGVVSIGARDGSKGTLTVDGAGSTLDFGAVLFLGAFEAQGDTSVNFTNGATVSHSGDSYLNSQGSAFSGIQLEGDGAKLTIDATSTVNTDIHITEGNFIVSAAIETVNLNGSLNQTGGEIDLQIAGTSSHDKLVTTGSSTLEGELNIAFENGFAGAAGDSFELFKATSFEVGGDFKLDVSGLGAGLDAQLQVSGTVASLVLFDSQVADFAIV